MPAAEAAGEDLAEYGVWQLDRSTPVTADRILIYPNLLTGRDVHVFVHGGEISTIVTSPRRQWPRPRRRPGSRSNERSTSRPQHRST
jgi:hypothetical protein